jgi:hypothetical protein
MTVATHFPLTCLSAALQLEPHRLARSTLYSVLYYFILPLANFMLFFTFCAFSHLEHKSRVGWLIVHYIVIYESHPSSIFLWLFNVIINFIMTIKNRPSLSIFLSHSPPAESMKYSVILSCFLYGNYLMHWARSMHKLPSKIRKAGSTGCPHMKGKGKGKRKGNRWDRALFLISCLILHGRSTISKVPKWSTLCWFYFNPSTQSVHFASKLRK